MTMINQRPVTFLHAQPISAAAFAPYGQIVQHDGTGVLTIVPNAFERDETATTPSLNLLHFDTGVEIPLTLDRLERHTHSAQTFLTLKGGRCLVIVCDSAEDGSPLPKTLRAFIARAEQGITYRRNVWHRQVTPMDGPSEFAMTMMRHPADSDTEFYELETIIVVDL